MNPIIRNILAVIAGIIVGSIATAFFVLMIVFWIIAVVSISSGSFGP